MSQQINLYENRLRPVRTLFTARNLALCFLLVFGVVLAGALLSQSLARQKEQSLAAQRAALKAAQDQLAVLSKAQAERRIPAALQGELDQVRAVLGARREALAVLDSGQLGSTTGFAPLFAGFARLSSQDLWLTGFSVSHGGADIEIRGRMFDAARLPPYVQRLSAEPVFQGRRFAALTMLRAESEANAPVAVAPAVPAPAGSAAPAAKAPAAPRYIDFVLRSERAAEGAAADGGVK